MVNLKITMPFYFQDTIYPCSTEEKKNCVCAYACVLNSYFLNQNSEIRYESK